MPARTVDNSDENNFATESRSTTSATSSSSFFHPPASLQEKEVALKEVELESALFRELILQVKDQEDVKRVVKKLQTYKDNPYLLGELIFSKGRTQEKFGKNNELTRIHVEKSAWELMIWAHNYNLLLEPLKEFVGRADPTAKERAKFQTPPSIFHLQEPSDSRITAADHLGKDEKKEEKASGSDFESLIEALLKDLCTDEEAITPQFIAKLEEFKNTYLKVGVLAPLSQENVQILQQAYIAYVDNFPSLSTNQLRVLGKSIIDPLLSSLPAGFSSLRHNVPFMDLPGRRARDSRWDLFMLYKDKTKAFNQLLTWLKSPSQALDHKKHLRLTKSF